LLAREAKPKVHLMAEGKRLPRRWMRGGIIGHLLFGRGLLRTCTVIEKQQGQEKADMPDHDFLLPTSSMLVPKSLNIAAAALRPGKPVIEPPGGVQAPVW